jgi:hypothetical protein
MIVVSIPKRPDASPEKKADAASAHSSAVTANPLRCQADPKPNAAGIVAHERLDNRFRFRVDAGAASTSTPERPG